MWLGVARSKFYEWRKRYGKANEHNGKVPRDWWLEDWEKDAIIEFADRHPTEGYRRLAFMMIEADEVYVSPSTGYRVLRAAGRLGRWNRKPSRKGRGVVQPEGPHKHWHVEIAYVSIAGTFYYVCSVLDGYGRYIVHWEIRESMREGDVEIVLQRATERSPEARPRIISDNGPQFIARDFKNFIRMVGMTHVRTSPYYPQSNGKIERWHRTLKETAVRPACPSSIEQARRIVGEFVDHYNNERLHSAIGYVTPADKLARRKKEIWAERDRKLESAREQRRMRRRQVWRQAA